MRLPMLLLAALLSACAARSGRPPNPYTADQVERLLRGGIEPAKILADARRECIAFRITPEVTTLLVDAGGTEEFVRNLGGVCYRAPVPRPRSGP